MITNLAGSGLTLPVLHVPWLWLIVAAVVFVIVRKF